MRKAPGVYRRKVATTPTLGRWLQPAPTGQLRHRACGHIFGANFVVRWSFSFS